MKYTSLIGILLGLLLYIPNSTLSTTVAYISSDYVKVAQIAPKSLTTINLATYMSGTCQNYRPLLNKYNWNVSTMIAICSAESHGNTYATGYNTNGTIDRGILQINSSHDWMVSNPSDLYNPAINIAIAYRIWLGQGYNAWTTFSSGRYLRYEL